jgi:hypothetical protein
VYNQHPPGVLQLMQHAASVTHACCLTLLLVLADTKASAHQIMMMITAYSSRTKRLQE